MYEMCSFRRCDDKMSVWELCDKLRTERLLVSSEMNSLRELNVAVDNKFLELAALCWKNHHNRVSLRRLLNSHVLVTPENVASVIRQLDEVKPVEAYRRLGHHFMAVHRVLSVLHSNPKALAEVLCRTDSTPEGCSEDTVNAVYSFIFGACVFPQDEMIILEVLINLVDKQLVPAPDPRLLLRRGNTAFARLYRLFSDGLYAAKIFLTSALHSAVMGVLSEDDIFLDIDPAKSPQRYPAAERIRRFGEDPNSVTYARRMTAHRRLIVDKLISLAEKFVDGITSAINSFPPTLIVLVQHLHKSLIEIRGMSVLEARLICTDLIVTNLICPAIANPDTYGIISDTPVGHIARFNLMQMGQIVQMLAIHRLESTPAQFQPFINHFSTNNICSIVENVIAQQLPPLSNLFPTVIMENVDNVEIFHRKHFLGSLDELHILLRLIRGEALRGIVDDSIRSDIQAHTAKLPQAFSTSSTDANASPFHTGKSSRLRNFADKVHNSLQSSSSLNNRSESPQRQQNGVAPVPTVPDECFDVIYFAIDQNSEPVGLLPEEKFPGLNNLEKRRSGQKRARFLENGSTVGSAVSDRTTDNASDLEDEAAAQAEVGSVSSSQEAPVEDRLLLLDEDNESTLPDNLSDGVSGHGSPSLSGRDTPLSQGQQALEAETISSTAPGGISIDFSQRNLPRVPDTVRKQNAEGLEEIFGKFNVPTNDQTKRDDQRSLLSDCWSTNVVASDDEGSVAAQPPRAQPPGALLAAPEEPNRQRAVNRTGSLGGTAAGEDKSDTWSLDAIASDSEADSRREKDFREPEELLVPADLQLQLPPPIPQDGPVVRPLIDVSSVDLRIRRQSSGSSFSRSEADFEVREEARESDAAQASVAKLLDLAEPVAGASTSGSGTPPQNNEKSPDQPRSRMRLLQGLQRVGDKVRKGISTTPLRSLPQSSTLSDLLNLVDLDRNKPNESRLSESRSENRLSELDAQATADDILAKYQRPPPVPRDVNNMSPPMEQAPSLPAPSSSQYSTDDIFNSQSFHDAKRKLRLVLSSVGSLSMVQPNSGRVADRDQLLLLLNTLLAEAIHSREQVMSARVREVIRCLGAYDNKGVRRLLRVMRDEHHQRGSYVQYLQMSRLTLLRLRSYIDRLFARVEREKTLTAESLTDVLIPFYLENKDHQLRRMCHEFVQLHALDEKIECLSRSLTLMYSRFPSSSMFRDAPLPMHDYIRKALERAAMVSVFPSAFYPNTDADRYRDDVFSKALSRLCRTITPDHPMLRIPLDLRGEAPWPSARAELDIINAYKSARDKLACIVRCCETLSNLIAMSPNVTSTAADDITPILVYVVIQSNPHALLSNVQFVQSFAATMLDGAEGYWWTQFVAAIEFIKTLL